MKILVIILSVLIFVKTVSYGIYEIKENNKTGGIFVIIIAIISLIFPNIMVFTKNI